MCVVLLLSCVLGQMGSPIDPGLLAEIRASLREYESHFKSIGIKWDSETLSETPPPGMKRRSTNTTKIVQRHDMLDRFPLQRTLYEITWTYADGRQKTRSTNYYNSEDRQTVVGTDGKMAAIYRLEPSARRDQFSPLNAVGVRIEHSLNIRLSDLLSDEKFVLARTEATPDFGEAVVVTVLPGAPNRPPIWDSSYTMTFWLATNMAYAITRTESTKDGQFFRRFQNTDFRPIVDEATSQEVLFPHRIRGTDKYSDWLWQVDKVVGNPRVKEDVFVASLPQGCVVNDNIMMTSTIVGGSNAARESIKATTDDARTLLWNANIAEEQAGVRAEDSWPLVALGSFTLLVVSVALLVWSVFFRKRSLQ